MIMLTTSFIGATATNRLAEMKRSLAHRLEVGLGRGLDRLVARREEDQRALLGWTLAAADRRLEEAAPRGGHRRPHLRHALRG